MKRLFLKCVNSKFIHFVQNFVNSLINKHLRKAPCHFKYFPQTLLVKIPETIPAIPETLPDVLNLFMMSRIFSNESLALSVSPLRFVNNVDIIETPLRSIISSGIWEPILTPTFSAS